jgi:hypothetical protein
MMPRYYFDIRTGEKIAHDPEGEELPDLAAAEKEAMLVAAQLAREKLVGDRELAVFVRDEGGTPVLMAELELRLRRLSGLLVTSPTGGAEQRSRGGHGDGR